MSNRRKFSAEFRAEAVELVISSGRPIAQVAPEIGVVEGTLGNWVRVWKEEHPEAGSSDPGPVEWAKLTALQAESAELKWEIDFLGYPEARRHIARRNGVARRASLTRSGIARALPRGVLSSSITERWPSGGWAPPPSAER